MSSILIKDMEMPKGRPVCIVIDAAGQARRYDLNNDRFADDELFEVIPAADVRPVVRGKWIKFPAALAYKNAYSSTHIVCSACEAIFDIVCNHTEPFNFCPNCGADMREDKT